MTSIGVPTAVNLTLWLQTPADAQARMPLAGVAGQIDKSPAARHAKRDRTGEW